MKIIVAIKQVPERDAQVQIDSTAKWIEEAEIHWALNESDAYALEEALQLKEKHGGEVVVVSAGPERVGSTIREALAKGADRAIHIDADDLGQRDALGVARLLAAAVKPENPDLVLTGLQSDDLGYGQTGVIMAELLGLPHASLILHVEKTEGGLTVKRELEEGWFQNIELPHARRADDSIRRQQAALCHADGDQAGQDQGDAAGFAGRAGSGSGAGGDA